MGDTSFWERPEIVERFARREPDHRLAEWTAEVGEPASTRVLDLGCAGGRNAVLLAGLGFDLVALDSSPAMVRETRRRIAGVLSEEEAGRRVVEGTMTDLSRFPDGFFDLVVALGVFHNAGSRREWAAALDEAARVLRPGAGLLVASFTDASDPDGTGLVPVPGEPHLYERPSGRNLLVPAEVLDAEMARRGLVPRVPTRTVRRETAAGGVRVTANAFYEKTA